MSSGSASTLAPRPFLLAKDGQIINIDYIVRIYIAAGTGKLTADMNTGANIELPGPPEQTLADLRLLLAFNARHP